MFHILKKRHQALPTISIHIHTHTYVSDLTLERRRQASPTTFMQRWWSIRGSFFRIFETISRTKKLNAEIRRSYPKTNNKKCDFKTSKISENTKISVPYLAQKNGIQRSVVPIIYICMNVFSYLYIYAYVHMYLYIYIYIDIHTKTQLKIGK